MNKEKKIIAGLIVWTFIHLGLLIFGGTYIGDESYRRMFYGLYEFPRFDWIEIYDFTELFVYVGGAWLIFFLFRYLKAK